MTDTNPPTGHSARSTGTPDAGHRAEPSTGQLVTQLSTELSDLVRGELALAKAEVTQSAKQAGIGAGLFGGAGVVALYGVGALVAAAILALTLVVDAWLAALIVAVALFVVAGIFALVGKKQVSGATPPVEKTTASLKADVETLKESAHRDSH
ncbi:MAG: phage holin family protein [Terracoccus sp.]